MILVTLQNEVKERQGSKGGVYVMIPEQTNGKNAWLNGEVAIWYDSGNDCWNIGSKSNIGTGACGISSTIDSQNPTLVGNDWEYLNNDDFVEANPGDITITNIEGKKP